MAKIAIHVHHEAFNSPNEGQIPQGLDCQVCPMGNTMNTHYKWCPRILDLFCDSYFPTMKHIHPIHSKTQQFLSLIEKKTIIFLFNNQLLNIQKQ
jgi:hypothetical protein